MMEKIPMSKRTESRRSLRKATTIASTANGLLIVEANVCKQSRLNKELGYNEPKLGVCFGCDGGYFGAAKWTRQKVTIQHHC